MFDFRNKFARNVYSQFGEDGIIAEICKRIKIKKGKCIEFGANDGKFCSNTYALLEKGWSGKMIEGNPEHTAALAENCTGLSVVTHIEYVTPANVNELVGDCDLLSIDCDGPDYGIWKAYTGNAKIVVIEINSSYPEWSGKVLVEGTAFKPMVELGISKGYFAVCHTGNVIFVQNKYKELFPEITEDPILYPELFFDKSWL